ncbi:acyl-CoA N-acyltransferase [Schizothecium vesticola]|uniref:Acyl-CoA N-acyltransferase n=1 Tax=Schizothecium vesticola TaxID=314040 RepID=A0AA40F0W7_9PEZI|nr:acyl-CoA N-acyltransferase [Schizothecium vesticola]
MPLRLRHATEADAPAMAAVSSRAFRETLSQILFPPRLRHLSQEDQETPWRASRTIRRMRDGKATLVVVDTADDGEETAVVGMAQWVRPVDKGAGAPPPPSSGGTVVAEDPAPATLDSEALDDFMKLLDEETKKVLGPDGSKHMWYLLVLTVDPDHHRRGIGGLLLRWGMEQAATEGRRAFIHATPEGKYLYEKFGFKSLSGFDVAGLRHDCMLWSPPPPAA